MYRSVFLASVMIILLTSCTSELEDQITPTPPTPSRIVISEILAGVEGNNNQDFIELYNTGDDIRDLTGWQLLYQLSDEGEVIPIYQWDDSTLIPPHGHLLLARMGERFEVDPDGWFDQSIVPPRGGLQLLNESGVVVDQISWGEGPESLREMRAAPAMQNGVALERQPGGDEGNAIDTDDNSTDFILREKPSPQNTGSPVTPVEPALFLVKLDAPPQVEPGELIHYNLSLTNVSEESQGSVQVEFHIPRDCELSGASPEATPQEDVLRWEVDTITANETIHFEIQVKAPWTYVDLIAKNNFVKVSYPTGYVFGESIWTQVVGGELPIGIARDLVGENVEVEGIATMYSGGFYAGSGNVKFYLQDDTGGVQVWVPDGLDEVDVPIGARVRVRGLMDRYLGAAELITDQPSDVDILEITDGLSAELIEMSQVIDQPASVVGELVQVRGTLIRLDEGSYGYEVDLVDETGALISMYIDKLTEFQGEMLDLGQKYAVTGILERKNDTHLLNPRLQSDFVEILNPGLYIEADAPPSVEPGVSFEVVLSLTNHSGDPLEGIEVWSVMPSEEAQVVQILDGGTTHGGDIWWEVDELGDGEGTQVRFQLLATEGTEVYSNTDYGARASNGLESMEIAPLNVFIGRGVPIWAVQGSAAASPYKLDFLTTAGVVTGVFPELGGFWIQETTTDDDPTTSSGLFIDTSELDIDLHIGDYVEVTGQVREIGQQTQLLLSTSEDVRVLASGYLLPVAVPLDPPMDAQASLNYYEALEGMLVAVTEEAIAVSPTSKYGEFTVVLSRHQVHRLWRGQTTGMAIMIDDGSSLVHADRELLPYVISSGDLVQDVIGPLAYTYGNFKIEPIELPTIQNQATQLPSIAPIESDEFSIMTWNVENLFDILQPHPYNPPIMRKAEYELTLTKVANTILAAGVPTIIGFQEVENLKVLRDLSEHELLAEFEYLPALIDGTDSRGIDVGYLVRGDRAQVIEVIQHPAEGGLTSRPPLQITVIVGEGEQELELVILNNHFTSLSGGELATEPRRSAQAAWNVEILASLSIPDEKGVVVLGDLNSFPDTPPIDLLRQAGLIDSLEMVAPDVRYTYIYQGISQVLDHLLISQSLYERLEEVVILHTNVDYPPPGSDDASPERKSDHDPVIAFFTLLP